MDTELSFISAFVDNVNDYIIAHNLTINKFAKEIKVAETAVYKWISLEYFPTPACAITVAKTLDCSLDYLFGLTETKTPFKQNNNLDFLSQFEKLCKDNGVSHYKVAKACGLGESMISKWKRGKQPKTETVIKLATYFNCPIDMLI